MLSKVLFIVSFITLLFNFVYSQDDSNWVIRIRDAEGNVKKLITVENCLSEISNLSILRGAPEEAVNIILTNDLQLWQFASQLIEQELMYMKAVEEGYDKDEEIVKLISKERDNQISQLYMQEKVSDDFGVVSDEEKRRFFNNNKARIQAAVGPNVTYEQVAMDIETTILQERMRNEYDKIIDAAKTNYNLVYSLETGEKIEVTNFIKDFDDSELKSIMRDKLLSIEDRDEESYLVPLDEITLADTSFYIYADGVHFVWPIYTITPYILGETEIVLSFNQIRPFIKDEYLSIIE